MKVAGTLFCVSAVLSALVALVSRDGAGTQPAAAQAGAFGGAFLVLVFGLALIQGVGAVRILVLVCAALGSLALVAMAAVFHSVRELQLVALAALLTTVGYLVLLLQKEAPKARVVVAVGLIVAGAAASLSAPVWLSGISRRAFGDALSKEASEQREFSDPAAGLSLTVPEDWVILREDTELYRGVPSKVTLAHPGAGTVAFINYEQRRPGLLTLDHYLDAVLEGLNESGLEAEQSGRSDVTVGKAGARRMALTWKEEGRPVSGFFSTWLDGDRIFMFIGAVPGRWTRSADERFADLEQALQFTAPVETALTDAEERLTAVCPIFTATSVRVGERAREKTPAP